MKPGQGISQHQRIGIENVLSHHMCRSIQTVSILQIYGRSLSIESRVVSTHRYNAYTSLHSTPFVQQDRPSILLLVRWSCVFLLCSLLSSLSRFSAPLIFDGIACSSLPILISTLPFHPQSNKYRITYTKSLVTILIVNINAQPGTNPTAKRT